MKFKGQNREQFTIMKHAQYHNTTILCACDFTCRCCASNLYFVIINGHMLPHLVVMYVRVCVCVCVCACVCVCVRACVRARAFSALASVSACMHVQVCTVYIE